MGDSIARNIKVSGCALPIYATQAIKIWIGSGMLLRLTNHLVYRMEGLLRLMCITALPTITSCRLHRFQLNGYDLDYQFQTHLATRTVHVRSHSGKCDCSRFTALTLRASSSSRASIHFKVYIFLTITMFPVLWSPFPFTLHQRHY